MARPQVGERVFAICGTNDDGIVEVFGGGVYIGHQRPPSGPFGLSLDDLGKGYTNPCIALDSGKRVFGFECWWGAEDTVRRSLEGRTTITVDIDAARERAAALDAPPSDGGAG